MCSTDIVSIQKDEIKAIRSIFGKEFKLIRPKNSKKNYEPPCLSITISCSASIIGVEMSVQLLFDCSDTYPLIAPQISLKDAKSLSSKLQDELLLLLRAKSSELLGVPMVHHLVEYARDFLNGFRMPVHVTQSALKDQNVVMYGNKQREINLQRLRERKDSAKKDAFGEKYSEKCTNLQHSGSMVLLFEHCIDKVSIEVFRGMCEGTHSVKTISGSGKMVINCFEGFHLTKGYAMKVHQISFQNLSKKLLDHLKQNWLKKLEEDFYFLYKLSHPNVLPFLAFRYQVNNKDVEEERTYELDIQFLSPNLGGMKLATLCTMELETERSTQASPQLPMAKIRLYLKQVIDGVRYLHEKNVTNIKINMDLIPVDKDFNLKITQYYIGKRFDELKCPRQKEDDITCVKKGSKRNDIIKIGKLAKQLFFFGLPDNEMNEEDLPGELMAFIDYTRSNCSDLHKHPFLCPQVSLDDSFMENESNVPVQDELSAWKRFDKFSRIPTEFELICKLGEGAFGDVVKVKNIYDSQHYAIKRVRLNALKKKASKRTMKEVQLLSSLNHENIVRYYASWSEEVVVSDPTTLLSSTDMTYNYSLANNLSLGLSIIKKPVLSSSLFEMEEDLDMANSHFCDPSSSESNHFFNIDSDSDEESNESDSDTSVAHCAKDVASNDGYVNEQVIKEIQTLANKTCKFLMIQMELCEGPCNTLHKYINEEKLYLNEKLIWKFIREMVSGLEHIHSKNMIHRDLKPTNIFIDFQKKVKIGDLGLATSFVPKSMDTPSSALVESQIVSSENGLVGTLMYICPEMMNHKPYNNKADMYSLGIILFEMCHTPFSTTCERLKILGLIREPEINFPIEREFKMKDKFKDLISSLLNHDPVKRPSASELLGSNIIPPPEAREVELRKGLKEITKNRSSNMYKLLLTNMFGQTSSKSGVYELPLLYQSPFKYYLTNTKPHALQLSKKKYLLHLDEGDYTFFTTRRLITRSIESIFISHGAVEFMAPLLSPKTILKESHAFTLLDCEGTVVNLPTNLRENFAHFLLNNDISTTRRYAVGPIYQQQEYRRDHPKELLEAAFDIVSDYESSNKAVECLYVLNEVFIKLFNREHLKLKLEINHTELFHGVMEYYKIPDSVVQRILSSVHEKPNFDMMYLDSEEFKQSTSLSESQLTHLRSILTYYGRPEDLEKFLKVFFYKSRENPCCKTISDAFNELLTIVQMWERFPQPSCFEVNVRPAYVPKQHLYRGFVFQLTLAVQDEFVKPVGHTNVIVKYLRSVKKVCLGGDYSKYMMSTDRQLMGEDGDVTRYVHAVGLSIDISTLIQSVYSIEQLVLMMSEAEGKYECTMNSAISAVVQYDAYFDKSCREMLAAMWKAGIPAVLYDKDNAAEDYVVVNKIDFLIKFLKREDRRTVSDCRIVVKRNDWKVIGLEQISTDDCKTVEKAVEIIKEQKKKETYISKLEKEYVQTLQRQQSDSPTVDTPPDPDTKRPVYQKPEFATGRYVYVFVNVKESRHNKIDLKYLAETNRHILSLRQKNPDFELAHIQLLVDLNQRLLHINKLFQGKLPGQIYVIVVELSYRKCLQVTSEVSHKSLKDPTKLTKIISAIESSVNYTTNSEKHWKDVLCRMWKEIQEAAKDKIFKLLLYSLVDDNLVFVEIK